MSAVVSPVAVESADVAGAPPEGANTLEMTSEQLAALYPDGPKALPPELSG